MVATGNKIDTTNFKEISADGENGSWARLLWQDSGRVIILSDYGNWSYYWGHRGDASVPSFLAKLDIEYMGKKMLGVDLYEYCDVSTVQCIKETILQYRRDGSLTKDEAEFEWRLVNEYEDEGFCKEIFRQWGEETEYFRDDWYEYSRTEICSEWKYFWKYLWEPHIQPILKESLNVITR